MAIQMTEVQWEALCDAVTEQMKIHTRPFVTPLVQDVMGKAPENGTGTYLDRDGVTVLTCDHAAVHEPFLHQFYDNDPLVPLPVSWVGEAYPIDASIAAVPQDHWDSVPHLSRPLSMSRFAAKHQPVDRELFFFRGVAGENVIVGANHSRVISTGYCSQEKPGTGTPQIFEVLWDPAKTTVTKATDAEIRKQFKYDDPAGFSGSLVWNTRFVERGCDLSTWTPWDAEVTGLLREWDTGTKTLLVWRVEHLLAWLAQR